MFSTIAMYSYSDKIFIKPFKHHIQQQKKE